MGQRMEIEILRIYSSRYAARRYNKTSEFSKREFLSSIRNERYLLLGKFVSGFLYRHRGVLQSSSSLQENELSIFSRKKTSQKGKNRKRLFIVFAKWRSILTIHPLSFLRHSFSKFKTNRDFEKQKLTRNFFRAGTLYNPFFFLRILTTPNIKKPLSL